MPNDLKTIQAQVQLLDDRALLDILPAQTRKACATAAERILNAAPIMVQRLTELAGGGRRSFQTEAGDTGEAAREDDAEPHHVIRHNHHGLRLYFDVAGKLIFNIARAELASKKASKDALKDSPYADLCDGMTPEKIDKLGRVVDSIVELKVDEMDEAALVEVERKIAARRAKQNGS